MAKREELIDRLYPRLAQLTAVLDVTRVAQESDGGALLEASVPGALDCAVQMLEDIEKDVRALAELTKERPAPTLVPGPKKGAANG